MMCAIKLVIVNVFMMNVRKNQLVSSFILFVYTLSIFFFVLDNDPLSASNLVNFWQKEKCKLLKISQNYHSSIYSQNIIDYVDNKKIINTFNISGLGCKTNTSLTLIAMDSLMYFYFAERLGINILKKKDKTAAVIINEKVGNFFCLKVTELIIVEFFLARDASHIGR